MELSGEDASRADQAFLSDGLSRWCGKGCRPLCFCDTVGLLTPEKIAEIIPPLAGIAPLSIHCHDDLGFALANTVAALKAGAGCAHMTVNGLGERAGNTPFEELVLSLEVLYGVPDRDKKGRDLWSFDAGIPAHVAPLPVNKAMVGEMAFTHESGIHAHGVIREPATYESIRPEQVGRQRRIVLGKHSGTASVEAALHEMKYSPNEQQPSKPLFPG